MDPRRQVCACLLGIPDAKLHVKDLESFPLAQLWWKAGLLLKARFWALDFDAILLCFALDNHNHMSPKKKNLRTLEKRSMDAGKERTYSVPIRLRHILGAQDLHKSCECFRTMWLMWPSKDKHMLCFLVTSGLSASCEYVVTRRHKMSLPPYSPTKAKRNND